MKNYTYGWKLKEQGWREIPEDSYTDYQKDRAEYISILSKAVSKAKCGWSGVRYAVMQYINDEINEYMVLWVENGGSRWIPIDGNSKGCCLSVLGENLW
jgi:hypothetical protein